ncbi:MAG: acyltransferase [Capsulimonas sp.]|uniref:acyltransferase family protein n=1 Tax=Capsulimonas sp. TaxID=2494211 RepID=UPI0032651F22
MATVPLSQIAPTPSEFQSAERLRLHFLDGIRGIAAFLVVIHHMWLHCFINADASLSPLWFQVMSIFKYGHYLVAVFIVLSGFCLMMPVAMSRGVMKKGFISYIGRRARRILPPYYASLVFAVALLALIPAIRADNGLISSTYHRSDMVGSLIAHFLLVHNLIPNWAHRIDGPMWSVATEWQIYFLFPLILLPIGRRWGSIAPIIAGLAIGFCTAGTFLKEAGFWYVGLFAIGMAACSACFPDKASPSVTQWSWPRMWGLFAILTLAAFVIAHLYHILILPSFDVVAGTLMAYFLIYCTKSATLSGGNGSVLRFLSSKPIVGLGNFSYSLYLIHFPLLLVGIALVSPYHFRSHINFLLYLLVGCPAILGISYLFHLIFERPFMNIPRVKAH